MKMKANTIRKLMDKPIMKEKVFTAGMLRDLDKLVASGEISYSRMVEILNIRSLSWMQEHKDLF